MLLPLSLSCEEHGSAVPVESTGAMKKGRKNAFSLIELLIVVALISILAFNAIVLVRDYLTQAEVTKTQANMDVIFLACNRYQQLEGRIPVRVVNLIGRYLRDHPLDAWGNPVVLMFSYVLSAGQDGVYGSSDDIMRSLKNYTSKEEEAADIASQLAGYARKWETDTGNRLENMPTLIQYIRDQGEEGVPVDPYGNKYELKSPPGVISTRGRDGKDGTDDDIDVPYRDPGRIIVADQQNHRVQIFDSTGSFLSEFGKSGSADGELNRPCSIAIDPSGNLYVADHDNQRIQKFDRDGNHQLTIPGTPTPNGLAVTNSGTIIVTVTGQHRVVAYDQSGSEVWNQTGFASPVGVVADAAGTVYVSNLGNNLITVLDSGGTPSGTSFGPYSRPGELELSPSGDIIIAEENGDQIRIIDINGNTKSILKPGNFALPIGSTMNNQGNLIVCDHNAHNVRIFDSSGTQLRIFGSFGSGPGQFSQPSDLVFSPTN